MEVWDGTYNEHDLEFGAFAITVRSKDGADNCIIDAQGNGRGFHFHNSETSSSVLEGFTIRNGYLASDYGGGIYCDGASPVIRFCVIEDCEAVGGGGIGVDNESSPSIEDTVIQNNRAANHGGGLYIVDSEPTLLRLTIDGNGFGDDPTDNGGGIYAIGPHLDQKTVLVEGCTVTGNAATSIAGGMGFLGGCVPNIVDCVVSGNSSDVEGGGIVLYAAAEGVVVSRCVITQNEAGTIGGGMSISGHDPENDLDVIVMNCLIADNQTFSGGQYDGGGGAFLIKTVTQFTNCTIANNDAGDGTGGGLFTRYSDVNVSNAIVYGNLADGVSNQLAGSNGATYVVTYSDVQGGYSGTGNINANPLFADDAGGDFRLSRGSPCIDAAKNGDCTGDCEDGDVLGATRMSDHLCTADTGNGSAPFIDMGCHEASRGLIYVDKDATGGNDGSSWANAYTDLQNAFSEAGDDAFESYDPAACEVWVAEGSYKTSPCTNCSDTDKQKSFALVDGVGVYGRFSGTETARSQRGLMAINETILTGLLGGVSPAQAYHVVTAGSGVTAAAVLDGFTVKKGKANGSSGSDLDKGGGVYLNAASPTLEGLKITTNQAEYGGGLYLKGGAKPKLTSLVFDDNDADFGAGLYSTASSWDGPATDCVFVRNAAADGSGGGRGGAAYIDNDSLGSGYTLDFLRCNFNNNTAVGEGGALYLTGSGRKPELTNCIFYGNQATGTDKGGGGLYVNRKVTLVNCTLANNTCTLEDGGAGMYNADGNSVLKNCILYFNDAAGDNSDEADQIAGSLGGMTVTYTCIDDLFTWTGQNDFNRNDDPIFVSESTDDYCINNTGCNTTCQSWSIDGGLDSLIGETVDLKKHTRKIDLKSGDEKVDMGPIETQNATGSPCG